MPDSQDPRRSWFDRPLFESLPALTGEALLFSVVVILAAISRLYNLGERVMSHDESLHVFFSWLLYRGQGYQYNPMMHGPLQFHLLALVYFLFGDSDFTARLPHAIASILTVFMLWKWRRYLGRAGTLVGAGLVLISPFMLYYGRYARNEAFVGLFALLTLYAILRYFETGRPRYLLLLTAATVLHFTSKETAFIYTAQALLFLAIYLVAKVSRATWSRPSLFNGFIIALGIGALLVGAAVGMTLYNGSQGTLSATQTLSPSNPGLAPGTGGNAGMQLPSSGLLFAIAALAFVAAAGLLVAGYGWGALRKERAFDMLILLGTLVLPQLSALPVKLVGWNPLDYAFTWPGWNFQALIAQGPVRVAVFFIPILALSVVLGLLWNKKLWLWNAALFYAVYVFFFTTVFTNWEGFFTGTVGALGYWLAQQGVARGSQPWYYYLLIQIPVYEFLPAMGLGLAAYLGFRKKAPAPLPAPDPERPAKTDGNQTFALLFWWSLSSLFAFTVAGEKMPWLTFHIALPMILLTAWALGQVIEGIDWQEYRERRGPLATLLIATLLASLALTLVGLLGSNPPFQGKTLDQLAASGSFLLSFFVAVGSAAGLLVLLAGWQSRNAIRLGTLVFFVLLSILTARAAFRAAYVNFDSAQEYLVYAHGASGIRDVMQQVATISKVTTDGTNLVLAYDANQPDQGVSWPFKWYLRNYPNATSFDQPSADLGNDPVILVDPNNFTTIQPIVADNYYRFDYIRMVWPNQDYFSLTWPRLRGALTDSKMRAAIFQIWLNRDYRAYASLLGSNAFTNATWEPSDRMELFVRKDIAAQVWQYGIGQAAAVAADPYTQGTIPLDAEKVFGTEGQGDGNLSDPHGIAIAPGGNVYIADTNNNRIEEFSADGTFIRAWGGYAESTTSEAPLGLFDQPWGVAVSPDGQYVYVTDTWNHRIQKFTADGIPVTAWGKGVYGATDDPFGLWGPRGIAVGTDGRVFVSDTGNKRILVYDADGNYVTQFGGAGLNPGQFDEPVGLALDAQGNLYVADTWNQRIQVFAPSSDGLTYLPMRQWDVSGWTSQSLEDKPFLTVDAQDHLFVTDPEMYRVLEFSSTGTFLRAWGDYGTDAASFGLASAAAVDAQGRVWVTDAANARVMVFTLP